MSNPNGIVKTELKACVECQKPCNGRYHLDGHEFCSIGCMASYERRPVVYEVEVCEQEEKSSGPIKPETAEEGFAAFAEMAQRQKREQDEAGINRNDLQGFKRAEHDVGNIGKLAWNWLTRP